MCEIIFIKSGSSRNIKNGSDMENFLLRFRKWDWDVGITPGVRNKQKSSQIK